MSVTHNYKERITNSSYRGISASAEINEIYGINRIYKRISTHKIIQKAANPLDKFTPSYDPSNDDGNEFSDKNTFYYGH